MAPARARLLLNPYSRLGLQAVHHGHEVVRDQTLLAGGERLRLPPLPAPARTQPGETPPHQLPGPRTDPPRQHRDAGRGAVGSRRRGCWDTIGARSLFQDAELLALPQPQVPVVLGLVVVQGHHQLIWENKRRGRGLVANWGVCPQPPSATARPYLAGGSMAETWPRRTPGGRAPRSRCGSASARGRGAR